MEQLPPVDRSRRNFWLTWPGVILGGLAIVGVVLFYFVLPEVMAEQNPELEEIKSQLVARGYFSDVFQYLVTIEPVANYPKSRGRKLGEFIQGERELPSWSRTSHGIEREGYLTLIAQGYRTLSDRSPTSFQFIVRFAKKGDESLRIIKIEDGLVLASERTILHSEKTRAAAGPLLVE
jgi:hypothetical protein